MTTHDLDHLRYRIGRRQGAVSQASRQLRMRTLLFVINQYLS